MVYVKKQLLTPFQLPVLYSGYDYILEQKFVYMVYQSETVLIQKRAFRQCGVSSTQNYVSVLALSLFIGTNH